MIPNNYIVTLTNGNVEYDYRITAMGEEPAIILAQAEAINDARGYELVRIRKIPREGGWRLR